VYSRKLDGKELTFGHEGILYRNSFLMYDKGTESLWVHTTGQAVKGKYRGKVLKFLPSQIRSWAEWKRTHPKTTVLPGQRASRFMGSFSARAKPRSYGLSVGSGLDVKLYPYSVLMKSRVAHDKHDGRSIVIVFDPTHATATAWALPKPMRFSVVKGDAPAGSGMRIKDKKTKSVWDAFTGRCIEGAQKGEKLEPIPATAWLVSRWQGFFPKGAIYRGR